MPDPQITPDDGTDMPTEDRLQTGLTYLRSLPDGHEHEELWKLLSLAVFRLARLEACEQPTWSHVASPYLTLETLHDHIKTADYFARIERPNL